MKVQVIVNNKNVTAASTKLDVTVGPTDTALSLLERISTVTNTLCFPDQKLSFNGKDLPNKERLSSCGIKEGDSLEFSFQASDETLVKQLSDLIGDKTIATEELGLLYAHRHLVPVQDALKTLGHVKGKLQDFLCDKKTFIIDGSRVKLAKSQQATKPAASLCSIQEEPIQEKVLEEIEVKVTIELHVPGRAPERMASDENDDLKMLRLDASQSIARAKEIIAASEQMPFPDSELVFGQEVGRFQIEKKLADHMSLRDAGVRNGALLVMIVRASVDSLVSQLEGLLKERVGLSPNDLSLHYSQRFGTHVGTALRTLGLSSSLKRFLETQPQFSVAGGCVTLTQGPKLVTPPPRDDETDYMEKATQCPRNDISGPPSVQ